MGDQTVLDWKGSDVDATTIEGQLARLWTELQKDTPLHGAVRTHVFNLVVHAGDRETLDRVTDSLAHLTLRHPSRTIILLSDRTGQKSYIDATVQAFCQQTPDQPPLCHEQIEIFAHGRAASHLDSVVVPLLRPELRTYLWWPGQPPFGQYRFHRLLDVADQVIMDSAEFVSPGDGLANLFRLSRRKQGINDFNWARLTPWRDVITQFFDGPQWAPYAWQIRSARLEFGAGENLIRPISSTLLMLGWIGSLLGWEPETTLDTVITGDAEISVTARDRRIPIELHFADHGSSAAGLLMHLEIVSQPKDAPPARFTVTRERDLTNARVCTAVHEASEITRVVPMSTVPGAQILSDELDLSGHDRVYEQALEVAARMAGRDVWIAA